MRVHPKPTPTQFLLPRFTTDQVRIALGIHDESAERLHLIRNSRIAEYRIRATKGASTRDQEWSLADACRLGVVAAIAETATPKERHGVYGAVTPNHVERALKGEDLWLVLLPEEQGVYLGPKPLEFIRDRQVWGVALVHVTAVALFVATNLDHTLEARD